MVHPYLRRRGRQGEAELSDTGTGTGARQDVGRAVISGAGDAGAPSSVPVSRRARPIRLRRSMATFKVTGGIAHFKGKLISGMIERHYTREFAEADRLADRGFRLLRFSREPRSEFRLIAYASSWMKCHHPDVFCCALLNAQPMGFYAPAQIVRDAQAHGVEIRPVCVNTSRWDCTLEPGDGRFLAVRLGMRMVKGLSNAHAAEAIAARGDRTFGSVDGFCQGSRQNRRNEQYAK